MNEYIGVCPHCGQRKYSRYDVRCHYCGYPFIDEAKQKNNQEKNRKILNIVMLLSLAPFFLFGVLFFVVGLFSTISENKKIEGFVKTDAYFVEYSDCYNDGDGDTYCEGIYTYEVDGKKYYASPNEESNSFPEKREVYYNPNDPEEAIILANWSTLAIVGGVLALGCILVFFIVFICTKTKSKRHDKR